MKIDLTFQRLILDQGLKSFPNGFELEASDCKFSVAVINANLIYLANRELLEFHEIVDENGTDLISCQISLTAAGVDVALREAGIEPLS